MVQLFIGSYYGSGIAKRLKIRLPTGITTPLVTEMSLLPSLSPLRIVSKILRERSSSISPDALLLNSRVLGCCSLVTEEIGVEVEHGVCEQ